MFGPVGPLRIRREDPEDRLVQILKKQQADLGSFWNAHELFMLFSFVTLVILWLTRDPKVVEGWGK